MNMRILIGLSLLCMSLLQVQASWAASYSLPSASFPPCTGSWSQANNTCNNKIVLAAGDTVEASGSLTIKADAGIELKGSNRLGSNNANVSLASTYGDLLIGTGSQIYGSLSATSGDIVVSAGGNVSGSVSADGALRLTGAWVGGTVSGSGNGTLADSEVVGNVSISNSLTATNSRFGANVSSTGTVSLTLGQSVAGNIVGRNIVLSGMTVGGTVTGNGSGSFSDTTVVGNVSLQNGLGANNAVLHGTLTSTNGAVTFNGGSIAGLMNVGCCQVTVSGGATISNGIRAGNNGITISESTVTGDLSAGSNPIKLTNVAMLSGNISAGGNDVTITGGTLNANVTDANNVKLYGDTNVTGNLQARYTVAVTDSTLTGNIFGSSGYTLQHVYLYAASEVYGDVTVGKTWQTIEGDDQSRIYGVCTYGKVNPPSLCEGGPPKVVHHYELSYASQALTCQPHRVELKACVDEACSGIYSAAQSSVTLSPAGWVGGSTVSFIGSKELFLTIRSPSSVTLGIANPSPVASGSPALRCRINGVLSNQCALTFADSGLLVSVPPLIAGKSDTLTISAVRKSDNSPACIPAFANVTRPVQLWGRYIDPGPTEQRGNKLIQVGGQSVDSTPVTRNLAFNANGQAQSGVRYDDAGKMQLDARYQGDASRGDAGLVMEGNTQFVSRPYGLHISHDASCNGATVADCAKLVAAGDPFPLRIRAVAWTRDNQPRTASELAGNPTTPSFRLAGITLGSSVVAPAGGAAGSFSPGSYSHALGEQTEVQAQQSEVGIFRLTATPPPYFGHDIGGSEALVGRFVPAYLGVALENPVLLPGCEGSGFAYQEQPMSFSENAQLKVTGMNRQGQPTNNYDQGEFWRFNKSLMHRFFSSTGRSELDRQTLEGSVPPVDCTPSDTCKAARVDHDTIFEPFPNDVVSGDGSKSYRLIGKLRYLRNLDGLHESDLPFAAQLRLFIANEQLKDQDGIFYSIDRKNPSDYLTPEQALIGGVQVYLGRLRIENAHGPEYEPLLLPWVVESWQAPGVFRVSSGDSCSADEFNRITLTEYSAPLGEGDTEGDLLKSGASGKIELTAPRDGKTGSVRVGIESLPKWLQFDWDGDGVPDDASGLATFGIYQGHQPLIFRRELYR